MVRTGFKMRDLPQLISMLLQLIHRLQRLTPFTALDAKRLSFCFALAEKVTELQELLNKKDQEMKHMEDRYKKYLEKAKSVSIWKIIWLFRLNLTIIETKGTIFRCQDSDRYICIPW